MAFHNDQRSLRWSKYISWVFNHQLIGSMKTPICIFLITILFQSAIVPHPAQQHPPFYNEIQAFKKKDQEQAPPKNAIVFTGSSTIRLWPDIESYFPGYSVINRGFGGSKLPDVIRYANDVIFTYQPKQVVIYCGENDIASSDTTTAQLVFDRFKTLFGMIRNKLPKTSIAFIGFKPSPSRAKYFAKMLEFNKLAIDFIKQQKNADYIDVYSKMLHADGSPMQDLFKSDNLHMTEKGYAIWKAAIEPYLLK